MAPTPRIEGRRGSMEARGDVDTARQMGRLEAIRPRWDRIGGGSVVRFRDRSTRRTQISRRSTSGAELRVHHAPTSTSPKPAFLVARWAHHGFVFISDRTIWSADQRRTIVCFGQEGGKKYFNLSYALLSCRYPVVPYSTQVQEVGVEQWRTRRRHCLGFQRAGPSSEFACPQEAQASRQIVET